MKGLSKICFCIGDLERKVALETLSSQELCELRLDLMPNFEPLDELLDCRAKCVVTCRENSHQTISERKLLFLKAIQHSAYAIDLDLGDPLCAEVKELILSSDTKLILSYHNFTETPEITALREIRESAFKNGAEIFKLATLTKTKVDVLNLLSLLEDSREQIIIGMGELGKIVRVVAPYLGSLFTYVGTSNSKTAPGQLESAELKKCWQILGEP